MNSSTMSARHAVPASEVVTALRRIENGTVIPGNFVNEANRDRGVELSLDSVVRDIADLRIAVRHAFIGASPEYQLLIELSDNGLRDCAKCVRELEARAAQHPYNKMLTKIDAAYDAAMRMTRAGTKS
jgi:hypothetical protein